jgi:hypothetical protein
VRKASLYNKSAYNPGFGMKVSGIVLTSIGSAALVAEASAIGVDVGSPRSNGHMTWLLGVPLIGTSTVFAGVGIPSGW